MELIIVVGLVAAAFAAGVVVSNKVKANAQSEYDKLHGKLDKILGKVDPSATLPPKVAP